jgi:hypothetical protein
MNRLAVAKIYFHFRMVVGARVRRRAGWIIGVIKERSEETRGSVVVIASSSMRAWAKLSQAFHPPLGEWGPARV